MQNQANGNLFRLSIVAITASLAACTPGKVGFKAVIENDTLKLKDLAKSSAFLQQKDESGETPLTLAAREGNTRAAQILLEAGAEKDTRNGTGLSALAIAVGKGDLPTTKILLEHGADPAQLVSQGDSAPTLLAMCVHRKQFAACQLLVDKGANPDQTGAKGMTALQLAAYEGNAGGVDFLLKSRASCQINDPQGNSPLHLAIEGSGTEGRLEVVRGLLQKCKEFDGNVPDRDGNTALILASRKGDATIEKLLIESGVDLNARNKTSLETALFGASPEIVEMLLAA